MSERSYYSLCLCYHCYHCNCLQQWHESPSQKVCAHAGLKTTALLCLLYGWQHRETGKRGEGRESRKEDVFCVSVEHYELALITCPQCVLHRRETASHFVLTLSYNSKHATILSVVWKVSWSLTTGAQMSVSSFFVVLENLQMCNTRLIQSLGCMNSMHHHCRLLEGGTVTVTLTLNNYNSDRISSWKQE